MALRPVDGSADVELARDLSACIEPFFLLLYLLEENCVDHMSTQESLRKAQSTLSSLKHNLEANYQFVNQQSGLRKFKFGIVFRRYENPSP